MPAWSDKTADMVADATQIRGFTGEWRWLSNFHPCRMRYEGLAYGSSEEAYQAAKFPAELRPQFQGVGSYPAKKKAGLLLQGATPEAKAAWNARKSVVMREVVWAKFYQNRDLAALLISTGNRYLEETNWWGDTWFGVCRGKGQNILGLVLMETRAKLGGPGVVGAPLPANAQLSFL